MTNSDKNNYYLGGLAELVPKPTPLTYSFLKNWFTGKNSLGRAMQLLKLPYQKIDVPILALHNGNLVVNLDNEEKTIYEKTIFKYKPQKEITDSPKQIINPKKLLNPTHIVNTLKILVAQSRWIANPEKIINYYESLIKEIPEKNLTDILEINKILEENIWPKVIAVGLLTEFYHQLLIRDMGENYNQAIDYISNIVSENDWFFKSINDQEKVVTGKLSFEDFINEYGLRSDIDYEIASPRWYETKDEIKKRISKNISKAKGEKQNPQFADQKIIKTNIKAQLLRSSAKIKALFYINLLRQALIKLAKQEDIENYEFDFASIKLISFEKKPEDKIKRVSSVKRGKGMPVSYGQTQGKVLEIKTNSINVSTNTIGIFPNASPEFAFQYPKCKGIIFLSGGQTSHGSIVAREFGIPALIDQKASGIENGLTIKINGGTGEWELQ